MWKTIVIDGETTCYSVSDEGQVRNDKTNQIMHQGVQQDYQFVTLVLNTGVKRMRVHRLVAMAFIENPLNKPYVNHINGIRNDNKVANLEWVTPAENSQHAVQTGLMTGGGRKKAVIQYNLNGERMATFESATEAARQTGGTQSKITMCCRRQRETANDYQWRYYDDPIQDVKKIEKKFITGKKVAQCDEDGNILNIYPSFKAAAMAVGGTSSAISRVCSGTNIRHKGYKWKLVEEIVQEDI